MRERGDVLGFFAVFWFIFVVLLLLLYYLLDYHVFITYKIIVR